jgi:hypothetical protein
MEKMKKWLAKFSKKQIIAIVLSSIIVIIFIVLPMFYIVKAYVEAAAKTGGGFEVR